MDVNARRAFVRAHTRPARHGLVPEISLRLATDLMALWAASEDGGPRPPPFWAVAWPGGLALARYLLDHPEVARGRSVLDFGAGSGVAAVAAARCGARVQVADLDEIALAACLVNAEENQVDIDVCSVDPVVAGRWDVILAADVCYDQPSSVLIQAWLATQRRLGADVLMADGGRAFLQKSNLVEVESYLVDVDPDVENVAVRRTGVWRIG